MTTAEKATILYVEDEPFSNEFIIQKLEQDYFLIVAEDEDEALAQYDNNKVDLVLLDILLVAENEAFDLVCKLRDKGYKGRVLGYSNVIDRKIHGEAERFNIKIISKAVSYPQLKIEIDKHLTA